MNAPSVSPMGMIFMRILTGAIVFSLVYLIFLREKIERSDLLLFTICALTGSALNMSLFFMGLNFTTPIHASLVMTASPVMVAVFSYFIIKEKLSKINLVGILLALFGAIYLIYEPSMTMGKQTIMGDILVFLNGSSYALYLVFVKNLISKYHPFTILMMVFNLGFIMVLPFSIQDFNNIEWGSLDQNVIGSIVFVLIGTTCLAYFLNAFALKTVKSTTVASYIYLQPVIATIIAIFLKQDHLSLKIGISAALIFAGLYLVGKKNEKK